MPGITCCHIVHENVLCGNDRQVVWAALAGLAVFTSVLGKAGAFMRAAVTAVRGFKPIHPQSGVYGGAFFWRYSGV